jgi:hypothetical protein
MKIFLIVLAVCAAAIFSLSRFVSLDHYDSKGAILVANKGDDSPEKVLRALWEFAYNGNEKKLNEISQQSGNDWLGTCSGPRKVIEDVPINERFVLDSENKSLVELPEKSPVNFGDPPRKLEIGFNGENTSDSVRIHTQLIFASRIKWERIRISETRIFNDEALLVVEIANSYGDFSKSTSYWMAFKNVKGHWKVIGIASKGVFPDVDEQMGYGKFRPPCE